MVTLKSSGGLKTYQYNGKKINSIIFYNKARGVVMEVRRGWIEPSGSINHISKLDLPVDEIRNARAVRFDKGDVFLKKNTQYGDPEYALYIPTDLVNLRDIKEEIAYKNETETRFHTTYMISVNGDDVKLSCFPRTEKTEQGNKLAVLTQKMQDMGMRIHQGNIKDIVADKEIMQMLNELARG